MDGNAPGNDQSLLDILIKAYSSDDAQKTKLEALFKDLKLTSVFDISRLTEADFKLRVDTAIRVKQAVPQADQATDYATLSIDTQSLYNNARCYAAQVSALYREQQASGGVAQHQWHPLGIRAVTEQGPTYTHQFKENWDDACKNDSIAAIDSPVAYLRALYLFALQLECCPSQSADEKKHRILLEKRRPDLPELSIDQQSTFTAQPMLGIVNAILDRNIQDALKTTDDKGKSTYEVLAQRCYPFALPYEFFHHQCLLGLGGNKPTLGELNYLVSEFLPLRSYDASLYGKGLDISSDAAQLLMSGLGPKQQALLTERPWAERVLEDAAYAKLTPEEQRSQKDIHWEKIYGTASISGLETINTFLERTELKAEQMEALLAQGKYAPNSSPQYMLSAPSPQPFGARYVNGPQAVNDKSMTMDKEIKPAQIANATEERFERLHRMIRLQRWLDIPFTDLDALLCSAFESNLPKKNDQMQLNNYAIRALGIFRYLNRQYSIKAEEFAAVLHQVSPCSTGDNTSLFDKVFNQARVFDTPLKLDGRAFQADDSDPASHAIHQHLSVSLGLPKTEDSLLWVVKNTQKHLGSLKCDLPTVSSIYRQARTARMFGHSIADSITLVNLLGGDSISRCLATGDSGRRIFRISGRKGKDYFEMRAVFQLPEQGGPGEATLHAGSTLRTNTQWFADAKKDQRLVLQFSKAPGEIEAPWIDIDKIQTTNPNSQTSLTGGIIKWKVGHFDEYTDRKNTDLILQSLALSPETGMTSIGTLTGEIDQVILRNEADPAFSLLNILMQLDWITRWVKESAYDIPMLQRVLELQCSDDYPLGQLQQHLTKLKSDTLHCAVTAQEFATLALPKTVEWRAKLADTLLDDKGLVKNFAPRISDDVPQSLTNALDKVLAPLTVGSRLKDEYKQKLHGLLLLAHDRQQHLLEEFLQEAFLLPMNCGIDVMSWAKTPVHQILTTVLDSKDSHALARTLRPLLRHTEAAVRLQLSNKALRALLSTARWMDTSDGELRLSFKTLYLFNRFNHFLIAYQQPEEGLLSYLEFANGFGREAQTVNGRLAQLMNWTTTEVTAFTSKLISGRAQTMRDIDWVMRCHDTCKASGLSATALLKAVNLNNDSPVNQWKAVGEAIMAASH